MPNRSRMSRGWLRWLTPGLEVKRWLLLLLVAILIIDLGLSYALKALYTETQGLPAVTYYVTLQFIPKLLRAFLFGFVGLGLLTLAVVMLQRSVIGPLLPGSSRSMAEVIYAFRTRSRGPRMVAIGGGTGMSTLLRGLKDHTANLSAIVTVADDGGSSGRLREEYRILPPGDFRQCLVALADAEPLVKQLFNHRFKEGSLSGHSFGNLFIMAMAEVTGSFEHALRESGRVLAVRGSIIPSTLHDVTLVADVNGALVEGESNIPLRDQVITRVYLKPDDAELNPEAKQAIMAAEIIVCGPGSLYTSILPNLLVPGMVRAITQSPALKVFICNVAEQPGETDQFTVADHMRVLKEHIGDDVFDFVVVNSNLSRKPTGGQAKVTFDRQSAQSLAPTARYIEADVVNVVLPSHHDPDKLADAIMRRIWSA
ncbi:MAG TPA: gluconeogenesis factor YvcK family protein [Candidatus Nitrosotalea sp.]|nr:gluconeogenesis factor YvcK family protein [Candidatus Nitrosotalea sp.]